MPAVRMTGAPVQMVYNTRKGDSPSSGFPSYEDPVEPFKVSTHGMLPGYSGLSPPRCWEITKPSSFVVA